MSPKEGEVTSLRKDHHSSCTHYVSLWKGSDEPVRGKDGRRETGGGQPHSLSSLPWVSFRVVPTSRCYRSSVLDSTDGCTGPGPWGPTFGARRRVRLHLSFLPLDRCKSEPFPSTRFGCVGTTVRTRGPGRDGGGTRLGSHDMRDDGVSHGAPHYQLKSQSN